MRLLTLFEATSATPHKVIDPALMTFREFVTLTNPSGKSHPASAYDADLAQLNAYDRPEYTEVVNQIVVNGIAFVIKKKTDDQWDKKYVKTDANRDIIYGPDGLALYMDRDEIKAMIPESDRWHTDYAIIEKDSGKTVGVTENEWGTLLVMVASEFRGFGFGTMLVTLAREDKPDRNSGGFTNAGYNNLKRVHDKLVRKYLAAGFYSALIADGHITMEKVKAITSDMDPRKKHPQKNFDTSDPSDWLLMSDEQSFVVLYDRKIYDIPDMDDPQSDHFINRYIIGIATISSMGVDSPSWVHRLYGTDKIQGYLMYLLLVMEPKTALRMDSDMVDKVKAIIGPNRLHNATTKGHVAYYIDADTNPSWRNAVAAERQYRGKRDPYGEMFARILTIGESLGDPD